MKFKILLICCIAACYTMSAQVYLPIEYGDTKWKVTKTSVIGASGYNYFAMDSVVYTFGGTPHFRLQKQFTQNYVPSPGGFYLRNDTAAKRVYYFSISSNSDLLLYDFGASVGDTLNGVFNQPNILDTVKVDSIQNISVNGVIRKHVFVHSLVAGTGDPSTWIEGIGSTRELFYPSVVLADSSYTLDCQEHVTTRNFGTQQSCSLWSVSLREIEKKAINVYPNPAINKLFINTDELAAGKYSVKIFDLQSRQVVQVDKNIQSAFFIDVAHLNKGIYFLSLQSDKGAIFYSKFLKQ